MIPTSTACPASRAMPQFDDASPGTTNAGPVRLLLGGETHRPRIPMSAHQYAMVMDLNKCLGCQTCTMACKKQWTDHDGMEYMYWNNAETRPGKGYPRNWDAIG